MAQASVQIWVELPQDGDIGGYCDYAHAFSSSAAVLAKYGARAERLGGDDGFETFLIHDLDDPSRSNLIVLPIWIYPTD